MYTYNEIVLKAPLPGSPTNSSNPTNASIAATDPVITSQPSRSPMVGEAAFARRDCGARVVAVDGMTTTNKSGGAEIPRSGILRQSN